MKKKNTKATWRMFQPTYIHIFWTFTLMNLRAMSVTTYFPSPSSASVSSLVPASETSPGCCSLPGSPSTPLVCPWWLATTLLIIFHALASNNCSLLLICSSSITQHPVWKANKHSSTAKCTYYYTYTYTSVKSLLDCSYILRLKFAWFSLSSISVPVHLCFAFRTKRSWSQSPDKLYLIHLIHQIIAVQIWLIYLIFLVHPLHLQTCQFGVHLLKYQIFIKLWKFNLKHSTKHKLVEHPSKGFLCV